MRQIPLSKYKPKRILIMGASNNKRITPSDKSILNKIYLIRDQKVMLDKDLAELYAVETKVLKQ